MQTFAVTEALTLINLNSNLTLRSGQRHLSVTTKMKMISALMRKKQMSPEKKNKRNRRLKMIKLMTR